MDKKDIERTKEIILMENELSKVENIEKLRLSENMNALKGIQILKANNTTLLKKFEENFKVCKDYKIIPLKKDGHTSLRAYIEFFPYGSIWLNMDICFNGGDYDNKTNYCIYQKRNFYLGSHKNGVLDFVEEYKKRELFVLSEELKKLELLEKATLEKGKAKREIKSCFEDIYKYFKEVE